MIYGFMGLDPYGQAFHQGRSPHRLPACWSRNPAGRYAASISDILLQWTMLKVRERYQPAADALGISKWHMVATIVLPGSWKNILLSVILAIGRAMGKPWQ